jgi:DnaJ-class molecular chaperone
MKKQTRAIRTFFFSLLWISILVAATACASLSARQKKIDAYEASGQCFDCKGSGEVVCPECKGRGWTTCPKCSGSGKDPGVLTTSVGDQNMCSACKGQGQIACRNCDGMLRLSCNRCGRTGAAPKKPP